MMTESPELRVETLSEAQPTSAGSKAAYVAALFKGTLPKWPEAMIRISGGAFIASEFERGLIACGVPPRKIEIFTIDGSKVFPDLTPGFKPLKSAAGVGVQILYRPEQKRTVSAQFKMATGEPPVEVQFEVSPSGTEVEVGAQISVLKGYILKYAGASSADPSGKDRIRTIKIATKIVGLAQFDVGTQNKVATTIAGKVKEALTIQISKPLAIEFYGMGIAKYDTEKKESKLGSEFGLGLTITFD